MVGLGQMLGFKPHARGRISEAIALERALAHLRANGAMLTDKAMIGSVGVLVWDAAGRAVWRFCWHGPVPGSPDLVVEVDAGSGAVLRAGVPPR